MKTGTLLLVPRDHSVTAKFNCTFVTGAFGIVGECRSGLVTNLADGFHSAQRKNTFQYRHSLVSVVLISVIFNLMRFIILSYFPPL